jgi:ABC-2 type transport system ATP-binding protein
VIGDGRLVYDGDLSSLRNMLTGERRLIVDVESEETMIHDPDAVVVKREGHRLHLAFDSREVKAADLVKRIMARHAVRDLFVENPPIEEIMAQLYAEKLRR